MIIVVVYGLGDLANIGVAANLTLRNSEIPVFRYGNSGLVSEYI